MRKRTSWDVVSGRQYDETAKGRDVYNDQQMEREGLPEKQTMTLRLVLAVIASVLAALLFYMLWGVFASTSNKVFGTSSDRSEAVQEAREGNYAFLSEDFRMEPGDGAYEPYDAVLSVVRVEMPDRFMGSSPEGGKVTWADVFHFDWNETGSPGSHSEDSLDNADNAGSGDGVRYAFCPSCGTELEDGACPYCGWTVPEEPVMEENTGRNGMEEPVMISEGETEDAGPGDISEEESGLEKAEAEADFQDTDAGVEAVSGKSGLSKVGNAVGFRWKPYSSDQVFFSIMVGICTFGVLYEVLKRNLRAQNMLATTTDINQYKNDQHIMLPEEIHRAFDWFPDAGAHCSVIVHSLVSHSMLTNKGIRPVDMVSRYRQDVVDENGEVLAYKGEPVLDENGDPVVEVKPMFDKKFGQALFDTVDVRNPNRIFYDPTRIPYNPEGKRGKGKYDTVADFINADWEFPDYEVQRPAGAYLVDTAPVNTLVLAITRAGKGQTMIESTIDMWLRQKTPTNIVVNDPKGGVRRFVMKSYNLAA